jgi:alpha-D-xyloside xylohydrolase
MVGDAFLVAPFYEAGSTRDVALPAGASWYDWWATDADPVPGGTTLTAYAGASEPGRIPLFVREGAIVPMHVRDDATGIGTAGQASAQTWLVWPSATETTFTTHDEDGMTTTLTASASGITLSRIAGEAYVRVRVAARPPTLSTEAGPLTEVTDRATLDGSTEAWWWEAATRSAWIKLPVTATPRTITLP